MDKIKTIRALLSNIGMPQKQQADICVLTILAMANLKKRTKWFEATNEWLRIHDIIEFVNKNYNVSYAENSRETFRKQALHHFRNAALVEDNAKSTNSPNYRWRLTNEFVEILRNIDKTNIFLDEFKKNHQSLIDFYSSKKNFERIPVRINGNEMVFSKGAHNQLQKAIIEEFAPRFAPGAECLYVGDTTQKDLVKCEEKLRKLGFDITLHDKMPDVVLYREDKDWIYFVEAVTSVGPIDYKRMYEILTMTSDVPSGKIFVTAFPDIKTYKKFSEILAWETEIWLADSPDHLIHLNGDRFLGPR